MILKGSQRGGARRLAAHLLNTKDNEHVEIHEIRGFIADTLREALDEAHAVSKGTRCRQFLFSVSLNPPETENVPVSVFEDAIDRIESKTGLKGQPRAIVFHEKDGRRYAHAVWSRIDPENMKAINLPYFKNRLHELSKSLFLEHGWKLPRGMIDRARRNPLNFTREEWHQAKRRREERCRSVGQHRTRKRPLSVLWSVRASISHAATGADLLRWTGAVRSILSPGVPASGKRCYRPALVRRMRCPQSMM